MSDDEILARFVISPAHIAKPLPGELVDTFFEEVFTHGLSVQRVPKDWMRARKNVHRTGERNALRKRLEERLAGKPSTRKYLGCIHLPAGAVRQACSAADIQLRRIRVYDTSIPGNRTHAEVMGNTSGMTSKQVAAFKQQVRTRLLTMAMEQGLFKSPWLDPMDPGVVALNCAVQDNDLERRIGDVKGVRILPTRRAA